MPQGEQQIQTTKNFPLQQLQVRDSNGSSLSLHQQLRRIKKPEGFHFVYGIWRGNYLFKLVICFGLFSFLNQVLLRFEVLENTTLNGSLNYPMVVLEFYCFFSGVEYVRISH